MTDLNANGIKADVWVVYGTMPEYIKMKPLMAEMKKQEVSFLPICLGQHRILLKDDNLADQLGKLRRDLNSLDDNAQYLITIMGAMLDGAERNHSLPKLILVHGDTSSAFAAALSAFHHQIPVGHVEAGLRMVTCFGLPTSNKIEPFPEEYYRRMITQLATYHFCPTFNARKNVISEITSKNSMMCGFDTLALGRVYHTGNTAIDNLVDTITGPIPPGCREILVSLHRRENIPLIHQWITAINQQYLIMGADRTCAEYITVINHHNPHIRNAFKHLPLSPRFQLIEPIPHEEMIDRVANCFCVISDSGGLQEECHYFRKPIFVCRNGTERPEAVDDTTTIVTPDILRDMDLINIVKKFHNMNKVSRGLFFGSGDASVIITNLIKNNILPELQ